MDAGGIPACKPFYDKAKATFKTFVDPLNLMSDRFGFKVVPNGFLIDEAGILRYMKVGGFEVNSPAAVRAIEDFLARPAVDATPANEEPETRTDLAKRLQKDPEDFAAALSLGKLHLSEGKLDEAEPLLQKAADGLPKSQDAQFALGSWRVAKGDKPGALAQLRKALALDRENFVIRKQIWVVEHPEKFYPTIDWAWQREQLRKEREAEKSGG